MYANRCVGLVAVDEPVEVAEIPTVETWDRHDCRVTVSQPEGFTCKVQLRAKLDFPPEGVFDLLVDPDNARYFSNVAAVTYRKVLKDDKRGKQLVELEQAGEWRFLFWSGYFFTRLFIDQNARDGVIEFRLAKEGFMKNFTGRWEIRPFDQHSIDDATGHSNLLKNLGYRVQSLVKPKPECSLVTFEQSILPKREPPEWFRGYMTKVTASIIKTIITDLRNEIDRVKNDRPIPPAQINKLKKAKRFLDSQEKKETKTRHATPASLSFPRRRAVEILF